MPPKAKPTKTKPAESAPGAKTESPTEKNERVVLNVGGKKYETYKATLTKYEETLLGSMFLGKEPLPPATNGNEYFLDRDGYAFRYIIQFYRLGKIYLPVEENRIAREALQIEIDHFRLPVGIDDLALSKAGRKAVTKVDDFIKALERVFYELVEHFESAVTLHFLEPDELEVRGVQNALEVKIRDTLNPFQSFASFILARCGKEIGVHLRESVPELSWQMEYKQDKSMSRQLYEINMGVQRNLLDGAIFKHSKLSAAARSDTLS